jgi:hypothetical protein
LLRSYRLPSRVADKTGQAIAVAAFPAEAADASSCTPQDRVYESKLGLLGKSHKSKDCAAQLQLQR